MSATPRPATDPGERAESVAEQLLGRRVPPADAATSPGDATPRPDMYYRGPNRPHRDFIDSVAEQLLGRRVPPADAATAAGDATPRPDIHHRGPNRPHRDFIDRAVSGW